MYYILLLLVVSLKKKATLVYCPHWIIESESIDAAVW